MTTPAAPPRESQRPVPTVAYESEGYEDAVAALPAAVQEGRGYCVVFAGSNGTRKKEGVADLMDRAALNVHRFKVPPLVRPRYIETQGNLREVFDKAGYDPALLCFDDAEALFTLPAEENASEDALTPADYFFQRVEAFPGVVLLCLDSAADLPRTPDDTIDVIVEF